MVFNRPHTLLFIKIQWPPAAWTMAPNRFKSIWRASQSSKLSLNFTVGYIYIYQVDSALCMVCRRAQYIRPVKLLFLLFINDLPIRYVATIAQFSSARFSRARIWSAPLNAANFQKRAIILLDLEWRARSSVFQNKVILLDFRPHNLNGLLKNRPLRTRGNEKMPAALLRYCTRATIII